MPQKSAKEIVAARQASMTPKQQMARENVQNLIKLRGQSQGKASVDVNIHGTFARGADWVKQGSDFDRANTRQRNTASTNFQWSGGQTEAARVAAGKQLKGFLKDVNRPTINRSSFGGNQGDINAIAHSHGGNVLGKALSQQDSPGIRNAIMLGTPQMSSDGQNTSWSKSGADRVKGKIQNIYDDKDLVQTTLARANEHAQGNLVSVGATFSQKDSITPQANIRIETGAWVSSTQAHSDTHDAKVGQLSNHLLKQDAHARTRTQTNLARGDNQIAKFQGALNNRPARMVFQKHD